MPERAACGIVGETIPRDSKESPMPESTRDSNGTLLHDGDSVTLIKDLKVKGTSETLKRGTLVKNIRLTGDAGEIECNTKQVKGLVLKTAFLKKA
jgi:protein PhnA